MSLRVMLWVQESAPVKNQGELAVLYALADRASDDGTGAWPSQAWIAYRARCSERTVRNHLKNLEKRGIIWRGDQNMVSHLSEDRRPIVWNIDTSKVREDDFKGWKNAQKQEKDERGENIAARQVLPHRGENISGRGGQNLPTNLSPEPVPEPVQPPIAPQGAGSAPPLFEDTGNDHVSEEEVFEERFQEIWSTYPYAGKITKKLGKQKLKSALKKTDWDTIITAVRAFAQEVRLKGTERKYVPHLSTWLNQERWELSQDSLVNDSSPQNDDGLGLLRSMMGQ